MAVFTAVSAAQLYELLKSYFGHYQVSRFEGITAGIENSNYWLDLELAGKLSQWVLTIFEMSDADDLPAIVRLTQHLARNHLPVPAPINDRQGIAIQNLAGKSCLLVPKVIGQHTASPGSKECQQAGQFLGKMHVVSQSLDLAVPLKRDIRWLQKNRDKLLKLNSANLSRADKCLLKDEIDSASRFTKTLKSSPEGWVHGDMFVDNVLFCDGRLSGVIDFYHACHDHFINDLAIACNDWCYRPGDGYQSELMTSLLAGYQQERKLTVCEQKIWPNALRLNALRFWISRLLSKYTDTYQRDAVFGQVYKDTEEMKQKILAARKLAPLC